MKRIYHHYKKWEDFKNGMYNKHSASDEEKLVVLAIDVLTDSDLFFNICLKILKNWKISSDVNLSNINCNRRAWLGQAACSYYAKVPETATRIAWSRMTENEHDEANMIANKVIMIYEANYKKIYQGMGNEMLF